MGITQSLAAILALFGVVLIVEGLNRDGKTQLAIGLSLALSSALALTFGDSIPSFDLHLVDPLPRWRDVAHPLPPPEPAPTPAPKAETMSTQAPVAYSINYSPTVSAKGYPRFLAIYPFEKFFELSKWQAPEQPFLKPLYTALHTNDWSLANVKAQEGLDQLARSDIQNKYYYQAHLTWARGIATMEMGKPADAAKLFDEAAKLLTYGNTSSYDVMRFQIDREIVNIYAGRSQSIFMRDIMPDLLVSEDTHQQEIALLHYARALSAAKSGLGETTNIELQAARNVADRMSHTKAIQPAGRLMTIFDDPFGAVGREKMIAAIARMPKPSETATPSAAPVSALTASPRFYAVYPRQIFMPDVDWTNPSNATLNSLYDALEAGRWQEADRLAVIAHAQYEANRDMHKVLSMVGPILWLQAVAKLESGNLESANNVMSIAQADIIASGPDEAEQKRLQVALEVFAALSSHSENFEVQDKMLQELKSGQPPPWHELALLYYAIALRAQTAGQSVKAALNINAARDAAAKLEVSGDQNAAARLRSVFAARFPNN